MTVRMEGSHSRGKILVLNGCSTWAHEGTSKASGTVDGDSLVSILAGMDRVPNCSWKGRTDFISDGWGAGGEYDTLLRNVSPILPPNLEFASPAERETFVSI